MKSDSLLRAACLVVEPWWGFWIDEDICLGEILIVAVYRLSERVKEIWIDGAFG